MKYIISGTNRPGSRTLIVAQIIQSIWKNLGETVEIIDLCDIGLEDVTGHQYGSDTLPKRLHEVIERINSADGLIFVCPEYNGSVPGALKYFIDFWKYPDTFESRPVAFVGLGGRFGGLRPVEHLQGVFGYRNAFMYPVRVFLTDIWTNLKEGQITDARQLALMEVQAAGFQKFVRALKSEKLDANSLEKTRA